MLTSLISLFTQRKVKKNLAMTGEITLRGKVLAVGGIKEKILAAKRAKIKEIVLSESNRHDIDEINSEYPAFSVHHVCMSATIQGFGTQIQMGALGDIHFEPIECVSTSGCVRW